MTTIATDGRTMAADGRVTIGGHIITDCAAKLRRAKDGSVIGFCGDTADLARFVDWYDRGAQPDEVVAVCDSFAALVMRGGEVRHYGCDLDPIVADLPIAIGGGGELAMGAMLGGVAPFDAVHLAAQRNAFTGGIVTIMTAMNA